ncbi:DEAD/DEAH box helicase [Lederbergia lenta]|uniref:Helicase n=1 Tax=Lederbergia lenta TaxID=1467 RepID=A0A2X4ZC06_LEDLE|nr:DEAD/DEAH box helicase [Lederbergia lenta]MEC2322911.1 DEAD/DEAH box helicase [Lederbergia lenta]SQI62025.1 helicase [Lederbergia lenta]
MKTNTNPDLPSTTLIPRDIQLFLSGRSLLQQELPFSQKIMNEYLSQGLIKLKPGIRIQHRTLRCERCANTVMRLFGRFPCANCGKECSYCRKCIMMGRVSTCTPLYSWNGPIPENNVTVSLQWQGELSPGQKLASEAVLQAIESSSEILIWAVCGAGKTEVLFAGIEKALQLGHRVCIATPRTDVVLELAPRFKKVFPTIDIAALYGGSDDRNLYAPLTISTTHQLLRFEAAFDAIVVDEVDAFPYTFDESLQWAVKKAAMLRSANIYLTATPSATWQIECKVGKRPHIKIPARYHRKPLPVPAFTWCGNWRKQLEKEIIPHKIIQWVRQRITAKKQALVFFPHIELMEKALPLFRRLHQAIESVHAEDPERKEKVESMRAKKIPILLTTTILERGVTFPNIDVAVIGAEDDTFTESALVQISGRVGRSASYPSGKITFFHYGRTQAMIKALTHIDEMNQEAQKKGLLS